MNKTFSSLLIKFVLTLGATWIAFGLMNDNSIGFILTTAIVGTILNYVLGDLLVLRNLGNITACVADGGMAMLTAYVVGLFTRNFTTTFATFVGFGALVAVAEYFFHIYLLNREEVAPNSEAKMFKPNTFNFDMEAGDEFHVDKDKDDVDNDDIDNNDEMNK